jgi:hypothetical protein
MNKVFILLSLSLALAACGSLKKGSSQKQAIGSWQTTPIAIDGDTRDWPSPYPNYDSKAKIAYASSNDAQYLYVTMQSGDELTQAKILKTGMRLAIDTGGEKAPSFFINYPLPNTSTDFDLGAPPESKEAALQMGKRTNAFIKTALEQSIQLSLEGFKGCEGGHTISQTLACGVKVKMRMDEYKELVWEAAIPFKALIGRDLEARDMGKNIAICFDIKGLGKPKSKGTDNINNTMGGPGGGMASNSTPGRGMPAAAMQGMRPGTENPMQALYNNTKTWKTFGVAYKQ